MKKFEMPTLQLQGSDKQVRWATDIITDVYTTANQNVKRVHDMQWPHADKWEEAFERIIIEVEAFLAKVDQAGVIITHRERFSSNRILYLANKYVNFGK